MAEGHRVSSIRRCGTTARGIVGAEAYRFLDPESQPLYRHYRYIDWILVLRPDRGTVTG